MLRQSRSARRSLGIAFAVLLGTLICGCGTPARRSAAEADDFDPQAFITQAQLLKDYVQALLLLDSKEAGDWRKGQEALESLAPFRIFNDDPQLIDLFRKGKPAEAEQARRELARRGRMMKDLFVFSTPYSKSAWEEAVRNLLATGEEGRALLTITLLKILINNTFQTVWPHVRECLVQTGEMGLETTAALAREKMRLSPETPLWQQQDMVQLSMALIAFGEKGRPHVMELARARNWNIRKAVALAIGASLDPALGNVLTGYLSDPEWQVRASAAESMGRLGIARGTLGPSLVEALRKEKDTFVLRSILQGVGEMHYIEAIPIVMNATEHPKYEVGQAAMLALYHLTGEKFKTSLQWARWYREVYPSWIRKQKP